MKDKNKFKEKIVKWIGTDGALHFTVCFALSAMLSNYFNIGLSLFVPVFIGFGKEVLWDAWMRKGTFQWKDLMFDVCGAIVAVLLLLPKLLMRQP